MRHRRVLEPGAAYFLVKHRLVARPSDWPHSTFHAWVEKGVYDPWWGSRDMPPIPEWAGQEYEDVGLRSARRC